MKINYTGRHMELSPAQADNLQAEFDKVARLLDTPKGEAQAHVILSHERHLNHAEVTVSYHHHEMVGQAAEVDLFAAIHAAVAKLEAQALKVKGKWRAGQRGLKVEAEPAA